MGRWSCILVVCATACGGDDSGSGDPAFGNATVTLDGSEQALRYAWMYPMRGAPLEMTSRNLGWTITFTETPTPVCTSNVRPPLCIEMWTAEELPDAVEGTATLPTDVDFEIAAGIVSFPSGLYGEAFLRLPDVADVLDVHAVLRLSAFSPAEMSGTLDGFAYVDARTIVPRDLLVTFDAHACP